MAAAWALIRLRATDAFRIVEKRWASGAAGAAAAGAVAGAAGGIALTLAPTSTGSASVIPLLAGLGVAAGGLAGAGVSAGIVFAEALARSRRGLAIVAGGAAGGAFAGAIGHFAVRWTLEGLFGIRLAFLGGPLDGVVIGAAAGAGYAVTTPRHGGGIAMATPRERVFAALTVALLCAGAGQLLVWADRPLVGAVINQVAEASRGSDLARTPLGYLISDPRFGPAMKFAMGVLECGLFGLGLAVGLTRRPRL
jgi:hypothetical protein